MIRVFTANCKFVGPAPFKYRHLRRVTLNFLQKLKQQKNRMLNSDTCTV